MCEEGCSLHGILPRALQHLAATDTTTDSTTNVNHLLEDVGLNPDEFSNLDTSLPGHDVSAWVELLQEAIDCKEMSFQEVNRKRKRLTFAAFQDPLLGMKATALEVLVEPNIHRIHVLFSRSKAIATLQQLPSSAADQRQELERKFLR